MVVQFDKNIFYPWETASAVISVDNSQSKVGVNVVEYQLVQRVVIGSKGFFSNIYKNDFPILGNTDKSGVQAGQPEVHK